MCDKTVRLKDMTTQSQYWMQSTSLQDTPKLTVTILSLCPSQSGWLRFPSSVSYGPHHRHLRLHTGHVIWCLPNIARRNARNLIARKAITVEWNKGSRRPRNPREDVSMFQEHMLSHPSICARTTRPLHLSAIILSIRLVAKLYHLHQAFSIHRNTTKPKGPQKNLFDVLTCQVDVT